MAALRRSAAHFGNQRLGEQLSIGFFRPRHPDRKRAFCPCNTRQAGQSAIGIFKRMKAMRPQGCHQNACQRNIVELSNYCKICQ